MSLHDVMAVVDDERLDDTDATILDDELFADEIAGIVEIAAAFLASAEGAGLAPGFATFTCGIYSLEELSADLWRLSAWIRGNA
jgi:hypothetical protein